MTSRIIKVSSRQNHPLTSQKNLVDFDIPSGLYDLSQSYLNVNVSVPSSNQNNITLLNLDRAKPDGTETGIQHSNTAFIRHCSLRSMTNGSIENNRHINLLKANTELYENSVSKSNSSEIISKFASRLDINSLGSSNYRELNKTGTTLSKDKAHNNVIRLKDLMNFCKNTYYDTEDKGELQLHLEFDIENVDVLQHLKSDNTYWAEKYKVQTNPTNGSFADQVAGSFNFVNTKRAFYNIDESPYYVGQGLTFAGTALTGSPADRQITEIEVNTDYTLKISVDTPLVFTGASTDLTAKSRDEIVANITPVFNFCELVLKQLDPSEKQPSQTYEYTTYQLQEDSQNTSSLNKNYMISPMCKNVYVCSPADNKVLLSNTRVNSYRFSIDNVYQQNRLIKFGTNRDSLHLSQVMKTYENKDEMLKNTRVFVQTVKKQEIDTFTDNLYSYMVMSPTQITETSKMLGVELNTETALGRVLIFEEVIKQL